MEFEVSFTDSDKSPVKVKVDANLSEVLTVQNSPLLFGCRTGICGTCAIEVISVKGADLHPRTSDEKEYLETMVPEHPNYRLACQIRLNTNICLRKVKI